MGILIVLMLSIATVSANPVLNLIGNKMVNEGDTLQFNITSSAPDSGSSTFIRNTSIGTLTKYNETKATFSWATDYDDSGVYSVEFSVIDGNSSDSETVTINVQNTNRAPTWTSSIPSQTIAEESDLFIVGNVNALVSDPDGDTITFSIGSEDTSKVDCMVDPDGTDLKIKPAADFSGTANCAVRARDSGALYADKSFSITVTNTPDAPVITSNAVRSADINEAYSYNVQANDPDGDTLVYSLLSSVEGMTIASDTGVISWTPNATGDYSVSVQVTDGTHTDVQSFTVTVDYPSKLQIYDIDFWVEGDHEDGADKTGGTVDKDVRPDSEIKMRVKLKNTYTSSEDVDIENVEVNAIILNIDDDGDDMEQDISVDDISPGRTETATMIFDVPLKVDEGEYDMTVEIAASDSNRDYDMTVDFIVKVSKKSHDIRISEAMLTPEILVCSRHANFEVEIINVGDNDEDVGDRIRLEVRGQQLGIDFVKSSIELDSNPDADDNSYKKTFSIDLADNFPLGIYPITVKVYRNNDDTDVVQKELLVEQCTLPTTIQQPSSSDSSASGGDEGDGSVVVNTGVDVTGGLPPGFEGYVVDTAEETSFTGSGLYVAILVIAILAVVGAGILVVVKFLVKPKGGFGQGQFNY
ncbi:putative Ig domain-containing protein [Candidatus Woesearchaeota archaeon]|nr:putative Ig domain-containing protein [Candidatus Woesearchaeota archaeon]